METSDPRGAEGEEELASADRADATNKPAPEPPDERDARLAELEDRWRRAAADLDNARKRAARELALARDAERARAASVFLPIVDGLADAVTYAKQVNDPLAEGIESIREQAVAALERLGYPRIDAAGVPFDPRIHEVVSVVDRDDLAPRTVAAVTRLGFGVPERLLRPAGVVVTATRE
ncbi:nucleotide exchange factor GrpE [Leifsonia sp. McL0607]|uniref:nucleotide exchange factor GrpE n=1 Tax=Leifsonia sp. McL0607 TaxID=3415672 RepID=UPI003CE94BE6